MADLKVVVLGNVYPDGVAYRANNLVVIDEEIAEPLIKRKLMSKSTKQIKWSISNGEKFKSHAQEVAKLRKKLGVTESDETPTPESTTEGSSENTAGTNNPEL